jgi:hypothetical protein
VTEAEAKALAILKVTEGNILSQWACAGREVFEPYKIWLAEVRAGIGVLEAANK